MVDLSMCVAAALALAVLASATAGAVEVCGGPDGDNLLETLERIDAAVGRDLAIPEADRRCGVFDLTWPRFVLVRGDEPAAGCVQAAGNATVRRILRESLEPEHAPTPEQARRQCYRAGGLLRGLAGRNAGVVCASVEGGGWRAETAHVEHGSSTYVLVGLVRHAAAAEYLERLARAVDLELCGPEPEKPWVHQFALREGAADWRLGLPLPPAFTASGSGVVLAPAATPACHESPVLDVDRAFNEALLSWNVEVPAGAGFVVDVRVGRRLAGSWSPWLRIGSWGEGVAAAEPLTRCAEGRVDVDIFRSEERYDRIQYRLTAGGAAGPIVVRRVSCCLSDSTALPWIEPDPPRLSSPQPDPAAVRCLPVPFLSQQDEDEALAGRVCSPVSVAMVLRYLGGEATTTEVASTLYDAEHDIYGNWARAVQGAFTYGVPGFLARFSDWTGVERLVAAGLPLVIRIAVREGELTGAPYRSSNGHLLVVTGFDGAGGVIVNDPAAATSAEGQRAYRRSELDRVWLERGGTAYVLSR